MVEGGGRGDTDDEIINGGLDRENVHARRREDTNEREKQRKRYIERKRDEKGEIEIEIEREIYYYLIFMLL